MLARNASTAVTQHEDSSSYGLLRLRLNQQKTQSIPKVCKYTSCKDAYMVKPGFKPDPPQL